MSGELMFVLILIVTIIAIIAAVILFNYAKKLGRDTDKGLAFTRAGWIVIAVYAALAITGIIYLCIETSFWVILLFVFLPIVILVGLILTITYGIYYMVEGNKKGNFDKRKVSIGMTCLIINASIVLAVGVLIILFMSGLIPIRLM